MPNPPPVPKKQTVLLNAEQPRSSGFDAVFKAPSQLGAAYQTHLDEVAGGKKTGNLQISKLDADKYMKAYAEAEKPPKEGVIRKQVSTSFWNLSTFLTRTFIFSSFILFFRLVRRRRSRRTATVFTDRIEVEAQHEDRLRFR